MLLSAFYLRGLFRLRAPPPIPRPLPDALLIGLSTTWLRLNVWSHSLFFELQSFVDSKFLHVASCYVAIFA